MSLALIISSVWYTDTSDDATGTIGPGDTESLVWTRTDASAPSGYPDLLRYQMNLGAIISM